MVAPGSSLQPIGVQAIWDGQDFTRGYQQYRAQLTDGNKATEDFARRTRRSTRDSSRAWEQHGGVVRQEMQKTEKGTRRYIQGIAAIYAMFRLAPQIAEQFGASMRDAVAGAAMRQGYQTMSRDAGVAFDSLLRDMQRASKGTVAEMELIRGVNRGLLVEGQRFAEAMPRLMEIARAAALATGQDLVYVFDSLTKGIARSSYRLIDNAEIYLRIGPVIRNYAEAQGKAVDELEFTERQMIILNEVLDQGKDLIEIYGDTAVDEFDRASAAVADLKQDFLEFSASLPAAPEIAAIASVANALAPIVQTIALLKLAGLDFGTIAAAIPIGLSTLAAPLAAVTAGFIVYNEVVRESAAVNKIFGQELPSTGRTLDMITTAVQREIRARIDSREAANEWFREVEGMTTIADLQAQASREMAKASQMYLDSLDTQKMEEYIQLQIQEGNILAAMITASELYNRTLAETRKEEERSAKLREALLERLQDETEKTWDAYADLAESRADLAKLEAEINQEAIEDAQEYADKIGAILRQAAFDRARAARSYQDDIIQAERNRQRSIEDAAYRHGRKLEDIEYNYRRRILEIEESYRKSVREGAIERDALAILRARERRSEDLTQAGRTRQDQIRSEGRNYEDSLRQAERAYQDRLYTARRAYEKELRELEFRLRERIRKENEAQQKRKAKQLSGNITELQEEKAQTERLRLELERRLRMKKLINNLIYGTTGGVPSWIQQWFRKGDPDFSGDEGFSGMVSGPTTMRIGSGVTEYVYASGNLGGGRQSVLPSPAASQARGMRAAVSGGVGVGLQGFNTSLMDKIGPELTQTVGQAVIDEIAAALTG